MDEAIPEADRVEQERPALPEDVVDDETDPSVDELEEAGSSVGDVWEADPADVADQHRVARVREDDEEDDWA